MTGPSKEILSASPRAADQPLGAGIKSCLVRWLGDARWPVVLVAALAFLLSLPALFGGIYRDDAMHRAILLGTRILPFETSSKPAG